MQPEETCEDGHYYRGSIHLVLGTVRLCQSFINVDVGILQYN